MPRSLPRSPDVPESRRGPASPTSDEPEAAGAPVASETTPPGEASRIATARRRGEAALAGLLGDEDAARERLRDEHGAVRAAALAALARLGRAGPAEVADALVDPDPDVRRNACELASSLPETDFAPLLEDPEPAVVEAAAFACGEIGDHRAVARLATLAGSHPDPLCRESAVAALGAIGDEGGRQAVLEALGDIPAIRRRAVVALAAFEGDDVEAALRGRLSDRDWQVRQAAEDVLGPDAAVEGTE
jgi:HEAT repeat protein